MRPRAHVAADRPEAGFTLTELVVVIVIAAILAAVAAARINVMSFRTEGFANEIGATLRYAQKIAISQRRNVTVSVSGNTLSLTYPDLGGAAVHRPPGTDPFTVGAPSGITLAGATFTFSALGRPSAGGIFTVTGDVARTITVEAETGYVH
jgi:MSHA pilin protein MshC